MNPKSSVPLDKLSNHPSELLLKVGIPESWIVPGTGGDPSPDAVSCRCQDPGVADVTSSVTSHSLTSHTASLPGDKSGLERDGLSLQIYRITQQKPRSCHRVLRLFSFFGRPSSGSRPMTSAAAAHQSQTSLRHHPSPPAAVSHHCRRQSATAAVGRRGRETSTTVHQRSPHSCRSLTQRHPQKKKLRSC